jgi:hypothetical protein
MRSRVPPKSAPREIWGHAQGMPPALSGRILIAFSKAGLNLGREPVYTARVRVTGDHREHPEGARTSRAVRLGAHL